MAEIPGYHALYILIIQRGKGVYIIPRRRWDNAGYPGGAPVCNDCVIAVLTSGRRLFAVGRTGDDSPWEVREYASWGREYCWITREDLTLAQHEKPIDPTDVERMKGFIRQYVHTLKESSFHFELPR